jgi:hypothetical protein
MISDKQGRLETCPYALLHPPTKPQPAHGVLPRKAEPRIPNQSLVGHQRVIRQPPDERAAVGRGVVNEKEGAAQSCGSFFLET